MIETVGGYEENKLTLIVNLEDNPEYKNLTIKEFCSIIAERYRYREMDYMYEPSIYPIGEYESFVEKIWRFDKYKIIYKMKLKKKKLKKLSGKRKFIKWNWKIFDKMESLGQEFYILDTEKNSK